MFEVLIETSFLPEYTTGVIRVILNTPSMRNGLRLQNHSLQQQQNKPNHCRDVCLSMDYVRLFQLVYSNFWSPPDSHDRLWLPHKSSLLSAATVNVSPPQTPRPQVRTSKRHSCAMLDLHTISHNISLPRQVKFKAERQPSIYHQ